MPKKHPLTQREFDILHLLAAGQTDRAIAGELGIARRTVSRHVSVILEKLDAATRTEAASIAIAQGLLVLDVNTHHFVPSE